MDKAGALLPYVPLLGKNIAINFGVGVVTGVVMEFELGTNWSRFVTAAANVFAPFLYFEVLTAFF